MMSETLVTYTTCLVEFAGAKYLQTCTLQVFSVMPYLVLYLIFEYLTYQNIGYIVLACIMKIPIFVTRCVLLPAPNNIQLYL